MFCPECGTYNDDDANFCLACGYRFSPGETTRAAPPSSSNTPPPPIDSKQSIGTPITYAGFWRRFFAYLVDLLLLNAALSLFLVFVQPWFLYMNTADDSFLIQWLWENHPELLDGMDLHLQFMIGYQFAYQLTLLAIALLYMSLFEASPLQGSLGKWILGILV